MKNRLTIQKGHYKRCIRIEILVIISIGYQVVQSIGDNLRPLYSVGDFLGPITE